MMDDPGKGITMRRSGWMIAGILAAGAGIFLMGQEGRTLWKEQQKINSATEPETEATINAVVPKECLLCSETKSVFAAKGQTEGEGETTLSTEEPEQEMAADSPLFLLNVDTGECIDLRLGNPKNSGNDRKTGRREIHFPEKGKATVKLLSLKERDLCEVTIYPGEGNDAFQCAKDRLCSKCLEKVMEGCTEYVLCNRSEKQFYPFVEGHRLFFAGEYAVYMDWEKEMEAVIFYSPTISCTWD